MVPFCQMALRPRTLLVKPRIPLIQRSISGQDFTPAVNGRRLITLAQRQTLGLLCIMWSNTSDLSPGTVWHIQ